MVVLICCVMRKSVTIVLYASNFGKYQPMIHDIKMETRNRFCFSNFGYAHSAGHICLCGMFVLCRAVNVQ